MALDIEISPELFREGLSRDIINRVQRYRKEQNFDITDHINIRFLPCPELNDVLSVYSAYIAEQVLADSIAVSDSADDENLVIFDIDDLKIGAVITLS